MSRLLCHESSLVYPEVQFAGSAFIGPHCSIGGFCFQHAEWSPEDFAAAERRVTRVGADARIMGNSVVCCGTTIGQRLRVDYHCLIGEDCVIGDDCVVEYGARIYSRVRIGSGTAVSGLVCNDGVIGRDCVVQGSLVHSRTAPEPEPAPVVEDGCFVGRGALIVGGIRLAEGTFVGAGAVVTKDTEGGFLYVGSPARRTSQRQWF